jgi:hypothetical protein
MNKKSMRLSSNAKLHCPWHHQKSSSIVAGTLPFLRILFENLPLDNLVWEVFVDKLKVVWLQFKSALIYVSVG